MPIQIDRLDTSIEIMPTPSSAAGGKSAERTPATPDPRSAGAFRDLVGQVLADELDRFMRNRGM